MSARNVITCDGCGNTIATDGAFALIEIEPRYLGPISIGTSRPQRGNYHACSVACLAMFAERLKESS